MPMNFVKNPGFPQSRCSFTGGGFVWKMQVREWAFADVDMNMNAVQVSVWGPAPEFPGINSNNPNVVPPVDDPDGVAVVYPWGTNRLTATFYAKAQGFTYIYPFSKSGNPRVALDNVLLIVEVLVRSASSPAALSLTKLQGTTVATNAPDAVSYEMDTTLTLSRSETEPENLSASMPSDVSHLVISSHGLGGGSYVCPWGITGSTRLTASNVEKVFARVKGKMAENGVIWFGGCAIGNNNEFCQKAANSSGCTVVAPTNSVPLTQFPKGFVDLLDRHAAPKVFVPGSADPVLLSSFCAKQRRHKFVVPV